jgi:hypothetical protein
MNLDPTVFVYAAWIMVAAILVPIANAMLLLWIS